MGVAAHLLGPFHIFHLSREALPQPLCERLLVRRKLLPGRFRPAQTRREPLLLRKRVLIWCAPRPTLARPPQS